MHHSLGKVQLTSFLLAISLLASSSLFAKELDRIVAVVEDGVILSSELESKLNSVKQKLQSQNTQLPPDSVIRKQLLERMVTNKIQRQMAARGGITADHATLQAAVARIAEGNGMTVEAFRSTLDQQGISYESFVDDLRNEVILNRLRSSVIDRTIKVSDHEIDRLLKVQGEHGGNQQAEFQLGHILIATPEAASPNQIQQARLLAEKTSEALKEGRDFKKTAVTISDGGQALQGGDLGWRKLGQLPTLFAELVIKMQKGDIEGPIQSPSGFHIIKLLNIRGVQKHMISQTRARHILIKTNDLISDEEAQKRLIDIKERLENGEDFATLARAHSDDTGSAIKGGELGWVSQGVLVKPFQETMNKLPIGVLSDPVQTEFGWHLIEVLERKNRDNTREYKRNKARQLIRRRKIEEEKVLWLRRIRDEAYVEIRLKDE
jgi:peptidyl-prolyl cis-trans isomerase SurA